MNKPLDIVSSVSYDNDDISVKVSDIPGNIRTILGQPPVINSLSIRVRVETTK